MQTDLTQIHTLFIDLDDTLYPQSSGVWDMLAARIDLYLLERMHIAPHEITPLRQHYFKTYGTTLRGLQLEHQVDMEDYLTFVHDVPIEKLLSADMALKQALLDCPLEKIILTNSDLRHAKRVLKALGIQTCFSRIIDINALAPYCKPQPEAFSKALQLASLSTAQGCMLFDDSIRNLHAAQSLGFTCIQVGAGNPSPDVPQIPNLHKLRDLFK